MSSRKQLKGIAAGLASTFVSRNNDLDGYWAVGVICAEAYEQGAEQVRFRLLPLSVDPEMRCGPFICAKYANYLSDRLKKLGLEEGEVIGVEIEVTFNCEVSFSK